jgi:hypothetical protein
MTYFSAFNGSVLFFILFFFSVTPFEKTSRPILTFNGSNGAAWPKASAFWGLKSLQFKFWGYLGPQTLKIFSSIGKSQPILTCRITFKRQEIDKKLQWNTNFKSGAGFQNLS